MCWLFTGSPLLLLSSLLSPLFSKGLYNNFTYTISSNDFGNCPQPYSDEFLQENKAEDDIERPCSDIFAGLIGVSTMTIYYNHNMKNLFYVLLCVH